MSASPASCSRSRRTWIRAIATASRSSASAPAASRRTWWSATAGWAKSIRASRAYRFFGRDRETISVAYAGDIIGLVNPGHFAIGDTLHSGDAVAVSRSPAVSGGALRARPPAGHPLQAIRRGAAAAGRRRADAGVLRQRAAPRADRRRRRRAAVRRDRQPSSHRYGVAVEIAPAEYAAARWLGIPRSRRRRREARACGR